MQTLSTSRVTAFRPACPTRRGAPVQRRASLNIVALGSINDPEKTKADKEKKASDSSWAEPHNKNPLQKKSLLRNDPENDPDQGNPAEDVSKAVEGATDKAKEALENAKDAISGDK